VRLSPSDRRHHLYVLGKSGTGKTTLLRNLILQDIEAGRGVAVLDPHGDLALDLIDHLPRHRTEDLIYLDPADEEFAVGFNPFANVPPARRHLVASGIVHAFKGIYPDFFGPRMEYIFFAAAAALLDCENVTLLGLQRMLTEEQYRTWVVKQVKDPAVRAFWEREFESYDKRTKAEMVSPILNKIGPILMTPQLRNVLGQVRSRVDARRIMDEGRVFIANLSIGRLGPDKANLLGSFLVSQFQLAAMSRADLPQDERRDFMLTVDEFHSFVSDSFASILSEARKYGLCLTLAHQYLAQLKPGIIDAIVGNVGSIVTFRVGHADAEVLEKAFGGAYVASQFSGLNNREVLVKMLSEGKDVEPFVGRTLPPLGKSRSPEAVLRRRERIIRRSRERNATPREVVERRLRAWFGTRP
jgi:type IV secretory pathway TraG/TraD family ATPase VirD4